MSLSRRMMRSGLHWNNWEDRIIKQLTTGHLLTAEEISVETKQSIKNVLNRLSDIRNFVLGEEFAMVKVYDKDTNNYMFMIETKDNLNGATSIWYHGKDYWRKNHNGTDYYFSNA